MRLRNFHVAAAISMLSLLFIFQNCGQGFQSQEWDEQLRSLNGSPNPGSPGDGGGNTPLNPTPTPMPTPTPTPVLKKQWVSMASENLRRGHTAVWTGTRMLVYGGGAGLGSYDPAVNQWQTINAAGAPAGAGGHTAVWTGTKMIVWGGSGTGINSGAIFDPATNTWTATPGAGAPSARTYHSAVWTGSQMIIFGGHSGTGLNANRYNTGAIYDPATNTWKAISTAGAPSPRSNHQAVWTGTKMIVFGGSGPGGGGVGNTGGMYDPATDSWQAISATGAPQISRANFAAVWTGTKMLVWGGFQPATDWLNTGGMYDPVTNTWETMSTTGALTKREGMAFAWTGSKVIIFGGYATGGAGSVKNDIALFDPATNTWEIPPSTGAPPPRGDGKAVWTGKQFLVFGGWQPGGSVGNIVGLSNNNTGGIFE